MSSGSVRPSFGPAPASSSSRARALVVGLDARKEGLELGVVGAGHRADRVERGETRASSSGSRSTYRTGTDGSLRRDGQCDASVAVNDVIGPAVDQHLLHPAHDVERACQRLLLATRVNAPVCRVREELVGPLLAGTDDAVAPALVARSSAAPPVRELFAIRVPLRSLDGRTTAASTLTWHRRGAASTSHGREVGPGLRSARPAALAPQQLLAPSTSYAGVGATIAPPYPERPRAPAR